MSKSIDKNKFKLYFETDQLTFDEFMKLIVSLRNERSLENIIMSFNDEGMKIHQEKEDCFILCASWDKPFISNNYLCPNLITIEINLPDFQSCLTKVKNNTHQTYFWHIKNTDDSYLQISIDPI